MTPTCRCCGQALPPGQEGLLGVATKSPVLAILLDRRGGLTRRELGRLLYPVNPPADVLKTVAVRVTQLRRALDATEWTVSTGPLGRVPAGYEHRYRLVKKEARSALSEGQ